MKAFIRMPRGERGAIGDFLARNGVAAVCAVTLALSIWSAAAGGAPAAQPVSAPVEAEENFETYLTEREQIRGLLVAQLEEMLESAVSDEAKREAEEELISLTRIIEREESVRLLLRGIGYPDALVTARDGCVNVLIRGELSREDAKAVLELVVRETGVDGGGVKIIALN